MSRQTPRTARPERPSFARQEGFSEPAASETNRILSPGVPVADRLLVMETITRQVDELRPQEKSAVELLLGHSLHGTERLILQIVDVEAAQPPTQDSPPDELLPAWCNVYEGLTDEEMEKIGESILRCNLTRSFE